LFLLLRGSTNAQENISHELKKEEGGMCEHSGFAIYILKVYLKAKEELWKNSNILHHAKNI
jgi:hypothetical protein